MPKNSEGSLRPTASLLAHNKGVMGRTRWWLGALMFVFVLTSVAIALSVLSALL